MRGILDLDQNFESVVEGNHTHRSGSLFTAPIMYTWAKQMDAKNILEVGIGSGSSAYWLGHAAKEMGGKYFGIELRIGAVNALIEIMSEADINHQIWNMNSMNLTSDFIKENIGRVDFVLLDGSHKLEAIWHEITTLWPHIRNDGKGYVFIHDIYTSSKEGWAKVKSEFPETMELKERSGMGIVRKT